MTLSIPTILHRIPAKSRGVLTTCLHGLAAGFSAVAFQWCIQGVYSLGLLRLSAQSPRVFLLGSLVLLLGSSLVVGWLLTAFCREAAGSGIPQLKLAFWKDFGQVPPRVIWVKFVAGVVSLGGGASMGREGPSVQLAGAVGSNLAALMGEPKQTRRAPAAAGAAAGLAAAFNTPLAAVTFVLEEIIGDLNSRLLGQVLLASVIGALVVHGLIGKQPSFKLSGADAPSWKGYLLIPVVAALSSLVGVAFQRLSLGLRQLTRNQTVVPLWMAPAAGGLLTWVLGSVLFLETGHLGVFSLGYDDLSSALAGDLGWQLALVLLLTKFMATVACYGTGGCGGIFSPTLFLGGMTGVFVAGVVSQEWPLSRVDALALAVVGMSSCLGAVVFAPVTGILIVFEMTHEFGLVPALMLGALVSQTISRRLSHENFYDSLLMQDGHRVEQLRPPRDLESWQLLPVSAIANFSPLLLTDLAADTLKNALSRHPYQQFPVVLEGTLAGLLSRREAEAAVEAGRVPSLVPAVSCLREAPIQRVQALLVESDSTVVLILDRPEGQVIGLVTLHDLLRAQTALVERGEWVN